jgi:hypothetical protein
LLSVAQKVEGGCKLTLQVPNLSFGPFSTDRVSKELNKFTSLAFIAHYDLPLEIWSVRGIFLKLYIC